MKKFLKFAIIAIFAVVSLSSCNSRVDAGYVGVKVNLLGSNKGVQNEVLGVGRYWIGWNEELYLYPTFQTNYVYTRDATEGSEANEEFSFQTNEGMECTVDLGVAAHFDVNKVTTMFQTYRKGADEIRGTVIKNEIRDALNKVAGNMPVENVYGAGKGKLIDTVKTIVKRKLAPNGIIIDNIYLIGSIRIPESIKAALDAKVGQTQKAMEAENKLRTAEANAKIAIANAEGDAKAIQIRGEALRTNPSVLTQMAIEKWDGHYPTTMLGGNAVPMISIK